MILPDSAEFNLKDCIIAGDECVLVTPKKISVKWNDSNKYFRSSVWRKSDMHLVSAGFRKFPNLGEQPEFEPWDENTHFKAITKIDGSCLIVSKYKGELIVRTRGTIDASTRPNGYEIALLKEKYPKVFNNEFLDTERVSFLYEWTTPTNRIVLTESTVPTLFLIGVVSNSDYSYVEQHVVDVLAEQLEVSRPKRFDLTLTNLKEYLKTNKTIEGVVLYSDNGQILKKIKTPRYLYMHKVFTGITNVDQLFDLFVEYGQPQRENFEALLATNYDWELVTALSSLMDELYAKAKYIADKVTLIILYFQNPDFIALNRKDKAQKILKMFPDCSGIAFAVLDGKDISPEKYWKTFS